MISGLNNRQRILAVLFFSVSPFLFPPAHANDISGYLGVEGRYFFNDPLLEEQEEHNGSLTGFVEAYRDFNDGDQRVAFEGFVRTDSVDSERTHFDAREAYFWNDFVQFEMYLGLRRIFWGVTESVHLVDIVNQTDTLENIDGEDKLGQPMVQLATIQDWGTLEGFVMPYFRERQFPGEESRLRPAPPILDEALYQNDKEQNHIDYAVRWSHYFGIWDIGLTYFDGTDRNPRFLPVQREDDSIALQPYYVQINQAGLDLQATINAWLLKLELISLEEKDYARNTALAAGFEYTFFTIAQTNGDLGLILEYQFDDRIGARRPTSQNDLVFGARWAFNDLDGSEILALFSQDLEYSNQFFSLELSRRLTDFWKIEAEFRSFNSIEQETPEFDLREDDYVQIELRRYF